VEGFAGGLTGRGPRRRPCRLVWKHRAELASGLMQHKSPFIVAELGPDVDPFMLHIYARRHLRKTSSTGASAAARSKAETDVSGTNTPSFHRSRTFAPGLP
jgi:hypothetical protein